jgi:uncharacterized short protein YbdD (DUF466 family)
MQRLKDLWQWLRRVSGDDAYDQYIAHLHAAHPERTVQDRTTFLRQRENEKWSGVKRCC